jgi:hypothetical protein
VCAHCCTSRRDWLNPPKLSGMTSDEIGDIEGVQAIHTDQEHMAYVIVAISIISHRKKRAQ